MRILLAEDEPELARWLVQALAQSALQVDWVNDGRLVLPALRGTRYDALVLDLGLPGREGTDVLEDLRDAGEQLPVLILTARDSLMGRVHLLRAGADDFLAKPFEMAELEARLLALVRRARGAEHPRFACGPLVWDPLAQQLLLRHQPLKLSAREHALLRALVQHSGEPMSKRDLLERLFADEADVQPEAVEVLVHRLRKRLEGSGVRITTLRGLGYVLEPGAQPQADAPAP
ncbi:response regulator [Pulveribacter sp.]|uniref:response regulator n=1 Tax=Pulveribacter sp. TaxID=2678893 RepID=UPI0028AEB804|nr:response regulator [Pulveribacter sp.]